MVYFCLIVGVSCVTLGCGCCIYVLFLLSRRRQPRSTRTTHSCPTRRSSDLPGSRRHSPGRCRRAGGAGADRSAGRGRKRQDRGAFRQLRSEEHTSELQSLMRISYAVFCLKKKTREQTRKETTHTDKTR